jgi:3-phenylpropionate/trans-cinnamate dioxygenase ferredoxin reductase subunit
MNPGLVIVGGCYAGFQVAASAREHGYAEPIRIVCEEPEPPYQRPPLSKGYLMGKVARGALPLRGEVFYREHSIELALGVRATAIDPGSRTVTLSDGRRLEYRQLALTTGATPRMLPVPGGDLDGVLPVRSLADADRLRERLPEIASVVVVGAGYIGLETASALCAMGKAVTVIEAQPRVLARSTSPALSAFFTRQHRARGVIIRLDDQVARIEGKNGRAIAVVLADGEKVAADLVIVGIGVAPNVELAASHGLAQSQGIVVDRFARTGAPDIFAAGDNTWHPNPYADGQIRLESVQNAIDQGKTVAAALTGQQKPYDAVPWFWSDQFELKLQTAGLSTGYDRIVQRGDPESAKFSLFYFAGERLIAVDSVNRPADHMLARRLVAARANFAAEKAGDEGFDLRSLLSADNRPSVRA